MIGSRPGRSRRWRLVVAALAALGLGLDFLPEPFAAAWIGSDPRGPMAFGPEWAGGPAGPLGSPSRLPRLPGGSPFAPRPEQFDETPDDAGELAWPETRLVLRLGTPRARVGTTPGAGLAADTPPRAALFVRARSARLVTADLPPVDLPIRLCRLTC